MNSQGIYALLACRAGYTQQFTVMYFGSHFSAIIVELV